MEQRFVRIRIGLAACLLLAGCLGRQAASEDPRGLHERLFILDSHTDTPLKLIAPGFDVALRNAPDDRWASQVDLPRAAAGGLDAAFFAAWVGQGERTEAGFARAKARAELLLDAIDRVCREHPGRVGFARGAKEALDISASGRLALLAGLENGYPIGRDLALLAHFAERGVRYVTLCHTANNDLCDSSTDPAGPEHRGLSALGREAVAEMNRLGLVVDVSHASDETFWDVLKASAAPVAATHSSCRALCPHPRNLDDEMIRALAAAGGVIQICALQEYLVPSDPERARLRDLETKALDQKYGEWEALSEERKLEARKAYRAIRERLAGPAAAVAHFCDHVDHAVRIAGIDHVGVGTDFDGGGGLADLRDVADLWRITAELVRRGYTEEQLRKLWGGNFLRVLGAAEQLAERP